MPRTARTPRLGRSIATAVDQVASSASNAVLVLAVAGVSGTRELGAFGVAYAALTMLVTIQRGMFAVHISLKADQPVAVTAEAQRALASLILLSPVSAAVVLVAGVLGWQELGAAGALLAVATPIVLLQDCLRFTAIAHQRAGVTLLADSVWFAAGLGALAWRWIGEPTMGDVVALWAAGAAAALILLAGRLRIRPDFHRLLPWLAGSWRGRIHLSLGAVVGAASVAVAAACVGAFAGTSVYGALAGAGQLMAPINVLVALIPLAVLPAAMRREPTARARLFWTAGLVVAAASLCVGFLLPHLPAGLGELLLGQTWPLARELSPTLGVQYALIALAAAGAALLTSLAATSAVLLLSVAQAVARVGVATAVSIWLGTAIGVARGETLVTLLLVVSTWYYGRAAARRAVRSAEPPRGPEPDV